MSSSIAFILGALGWTEVRLLNARQQSDLQNPNIKKIDNLESVTLDLNGKVSTLVIFTQTGLRNRPTAAPLNIAIISWRILGHSIIVINYGSLFKFQLLM